MSEFNSLHICKQYSLLWSSVHSKCKRHDNVRYECITNGLFGTLAIKRICSAVLLNCTKARIEPLFELNRTAASVASSNNGMPTFSTPSTQKKKHSCRMLEGEKNNLQAHTRKKNVIVNQGVEKKFHDQTKSPPPPPPSEVKWSAPKRDKPQGYTPYQRTLPQKPHRRND